MAPLIIQRARSGSCDRKIGLAAQGADHVGWLQVNQQAQRLAHARAATSVDGRNLVGSEGAVEKGHFINQPAPAVTARVDGGRSRFIANQGGHGLVSGVPDAARAGGAAQAVAVQITNQVRTVVGEGDKTPDIQRQPGLEIGETHRASAQIEPRLEVTIRNHQGKAIVLGLGENGVATGSVRAVAVRGGEHPGGQGQVGEGVGQDAIAHPDTIRPAAETEGLTDHAGGVGRAVEQAAVVGARQVEGIPIACPPTD